jgi:hypothetical protein
VNANDKRLLTAAAIRTVVSDPVILGAHVFAALGPADARTAISEAAAFRLRELTKERGVSPVFRRRAPLLAAVVVLRLLDDIDWMAVEVAVVKASRAGRSRRWRRK